MTRRGQAMRQRHAEHTTTENCERIFIGHEIPKHRRLSSISARSIQA
jgi:hypothetical protein